jgi:hypothetical protein
MSAQTTLAEAPRPARTTVRGRRLAVARAAWLALLVLIPAMFVAGVPVLLGAIEMICSAPSCQGGGRIDPAFARALEEVGLSQRFYATYYVTLDALYVLGYCAVAALIFWRRSDERVALFGAFALVLFGGTTFTEATTTLGASSASWAFPVGVLRILGAVAMLGFFLVFPDGRFIPRWTVAIVVLLAVVLGTGSVFPGSPVDIETWPPTLQLIANVGFYGGVVFAQIYRYQRVSTLAQRQQTKWVVFGVTAAVAGFYGESLLVQNPPPFVNPGAVGYRLLVAAGFNVFLLLVPLSIGIAILRSRLFDIDALINRTLVYSTLTAGLGLTYGGGVVLLQLLLRPLTQGLDLAIIGSTLAVVVLFQPARRRIQAAVDRRFYRSTYDAAQTLEAFSARLQQEVDLDAMTAELLGVVQQTLQPAHVSLWLRTPEQGSARGGLG